MIAILVLTVASVGQPPGGSGSSPEFSPEEVARLEARHLKNIGQVTFGFEKAGEGYFRPDDQSIIFQAVRNVHESVFHTPQPDEQGYQIFTAELRPDTPARLVSTGKGRCTCAFYHPSGK